MKIVGKVDRIDPKLVLQKATELNKFNSNLPVGKLYCAEYQDKLIGCYIKGEGKVLSYLFKLTSFELGLKIFCGVLIYPIRKNNVVGDYALSAFPTVLDPVEYNEVLLQLVEKYCSKHETDIHDTCFLDMKSKNILKVTLPEVMQALNVDKLTVYHDDSESLVATSEFNTKSISVSGIGASAHLALYDQLKLDNIQLAVYKGSKHGTPQVIYIDSNGQMFIYLPSIGLKSNKHVFHLETLTLDFVTETLKLSSEEAHIELKTNDVMKVIKKILEIPASGQVTEKLTSQTVKEF